MQEVCVTVSCYYCSRSGEIPGFHLLFQSWGVSLAVAAENHCSQAARVHVIGPRRSCPMMQKPHTDRALRVLRTQGRSWNQWLAHSVESTKSTQREKSPVLSRESQGWLYSVWAEAWHGWLTSFVCLLFHFCGYLDGKCRRVWGDWNAQTPPWSDSVAVLLPLDTFCLYPRLPSDLMCSWG